MTKTINAELAIHVDGVGKYFGFEPNLVKALDDVSIDIYRNEFFTLLGPSGCGKTTLLRLIAGFESPTFGQILLDNKDITHLPPYHRSVNTVFQSYALFPHLTVSENIRFGLEMREIVFLLYIAYVAVRDITFGYTFVPMCRSANILSDSR